jgi:hypothetical protein
MSRLRTGFYIDSPLEDDTTKADIDGLALEFVGNAEAHAPNHSSGPADSSFGIAIADFCCDGPTRRQG